MKRGNALHANCSRSAWNPFHNSSLHILDIQVFLAIDRNFHATVVLENEVSKGVMHTPKWSCMQDACTWKKWERSLWGANGGMSGEGSEIKKWVWYGDELRMN